MEKQMTFKALLVTLTVGILILGFYLFSGDNSQPDLSGAELVPVSSVEVLILESFPVQVNVVATGSLPNPCWEMGESTASRSGESFDVDLYAFPPAPDTVCIQMIKDFEEVISLDVYGLSAGTYSVDVNGVEAEFALTMDNVLMGEGASSEIVDEPLPEYSFDFSGEEIAGNGSPFIAFNQADYESALETDKTILLYFYAKWCPSCKRELRDALEPAFNSYTGDEFIGFRVNYNDRDTDDFEEALAEEFGVLYQHTKVLIKDGEVLEVFPNSWTEADYLANFELYK